MAARRDPYRDFEQRHGAEAARVARDMRDHITARSAADRLYGHLSIAERVLFDPLCVND